MKLERGDSCESSDMNYVENQIVFPFKKEKSPRDNIFVPRMTTHNSACPLKGLRTFEYIKKNFRQKISILMYIFDGHFEDGLDIYWTSGYVHKKK